MLIDKLQQEIIKLIDAMHKVAPDAVAAAGRSIVYDSAVSLLGSTLIFFTSIIVAFKLYRGWQNIETDLGKLQDGSREKDYYQQKAILETRETMLIVFTIVTTVAVVGGGIWWMGTVFDSNVWMGLFDQKAYFAHKILEKVLTK